MALELSDRNLAVSCAEVDIFGLGAVLYSLMPNETPGSQIWNLPPDDLLPRYNRRLRTLLARMIRTKPWERPKAGDIVQELRVLYDNREYFTRESNVW